MPSLQLPPRRLLAALLIALAAAAAIAGGLKLRRWAWDASENAHFRADILNAHRWGRAANRIGYLNLYRNRVDRQRRKANLQLDYPPLRLLIMERWGGWTRENFPKVRRWEPSYAFNKPLLRLNNAFELIASAAVFFLVALWTRRVIGDRAPPGGDRAPPSNRPWILGGLAALLVWFNPALIWVAHCWPQWDAWGVAVYLLAVLFASLGFWLAVGLALGVGALLKGQVLIVAAFFVLWPLFTRNFGGAARVLLGLFLGLVLGGSPWFLGVFPKNRWVFHPPAALWVAGVILGTAVLLFLWKRRNPAVRPAPWLAGATILAFVLCVPLFGSDLSWVKVGFLFGSGHFPVLRMGRTPNFPALLEIWVPALEGRATPALRGILWMVYVSGLVVVARWTARMAQSPHPRILAAFAAPWLISVALLPQMHERYLIYGAVATAMAAVALRGYILLHLTLTAIAVLAMVPIRLVPDLVRNGGDLHPVCMILVVAAAAACFAAAAAPRGLSPAPPPARNPARTPGGDAPTA